MPEVVEFRTQYIDDVDPFNVLASIKHAEPTVPKKYDFAKNLSLYDQLPGLKRHLRAPHKKVRCTSLHGDINPPLPPCIV